MQEIPDEALCVQCFPVVTVIGDRFSFGIRLELDACLGLIQFQIDPLAGQAAEQITVIREYALIGKDQICPDSQFPAEFPEGISVVGQAVQKLLPGFPDERQGGLSFCLQQHRIGLDKHRHALGKTRIIPSVVHSREHGIVPPGVLRDGIPESGGIKCVRAHIVLRAEGLDVPGIDAAALHHHCSGTGLGRVL